MKILCACDLLTALLEKLRCENLICISVGVVSCV
jgi:hypothetical protein